MKSYFAFQTGTTSCFRAGAFFATLGFKLWSTKSVFQNARKRGRKAQSRIRCEYCDKSFTRYVEGSVCCIMLKLAPYWADQSMKCTSVDIPARSHSNATSAVESLWVNTILKYTRGFTRVTILTLYVYGFRFIIVHTPGERPYVCKLCGKTFADPSTSRKHLLWHAGVRNNRCDVCGKLFVTKTQLRSVTISRVLVETSDTRVGHRSTNANTNVMHLCDYWTSYSSTRMSSRWF